MALNFSTCVSTIFLSLMFVFYLTPVHSILPDDQIFLPNFNQSFYLANETYTFQLFPLYNVPRQVLRHTIYTSSTAAIQSALKRAILTEPGTVTLSEEDHAMVYEFLEGDIPVPIKVDKKKRSLKVMEGDLRIVPVTSKATLITSNGYTRSMKRQSTPEIGEALCLHVEFFTTCDNSQDLSAVKTALSAAVAEINTELDNYKQVNDARVQAVAQSLSAQRNIINQLAQLQQTQNSLIANVAQGVQVNAAQIMDGDYQIHSQINYLKRITNSLLKYSNALASTDPRATVAQPSISKLFQGYIATMQNLTTIGYEAIVDTTNATAFTWTEILLPSESVSNITTPPCLALAAPYTCSSQPNSMTTVNAAIGFTAVFSYTCPTPAGSYPNVAACVSPGVLTVESTTNWIYGPFHKNHYGIYSVNVSMSSTTIQNVKIMRPIVQPKTSSVAITIPAGTPVFCVNFIGFTLFSSVYNPSLTLVNSYQPPLPASTNCDAMRILDTSNPTAGVIPAKLYSLYGESEGIVIPFYSNCDLPTLQNSLYAFNPSADIISTINYVCSNAWTLSQSTPLASACTNVSQYILNSEVFSQHWLTSTCYINMEPGWLGLDYYVNPPLLTIPNIPRGYQLNEFTINAYGELASSIEFVYTDTWLPVYSINRVSQNSIITDEISLLDGSLVLFYMDETEVIDGSDSMFGMGNNGRDCIQQSDRYDYNLLNCFFQNLSPSYPPNLYLSGSIYTSGIARYNSKFQFTLNTDSGISFSLVPKPDQDFSYYIEMDGNVCPLLVNQVTKSSGCIVDLFYLDKTNLVLLASSSQATIPVSFYSNSTQSVSIGIGTWTVDVGSKQCLILDCSYTIQFNVVKVTTPDVQIITAADKALVAQVQFSSDQTIASTVSTMERVISNVSTANQQIDSIRSQLSSLNFDTTQIYPYENFTKLRNDVQNLIDAIPTTNSSSNSPATNCDGPLNSIQCWFQNFLGAIVGIGLILAILVVIYCVVKKTGLAKKLSQGPSSSKIGRHIPEYRAD